MATRSRRSQRRIFEKAAQYFQRAIQVNESGKNGPYFEELAGCFALLGDLQKAVRYYDKALALGQACHYHQGILLNSLKEYDRALKCFKQLLASKPHHETAAIWRTATELELRKLQGELPSVTQLEPAEQPALQSDLQSEPEQGPQPRLPEVTQSKPDLTVELRSLLHTIANQTARAVSRISKKIESLNFRVNADSNSVKTAPPVYAITPNKMATPLIPKEHGCPEDFFFRMMSKGHLHAATCYSYLGDKIQTYFHAERSRFYNPSGSTARQALAICGYENPASWAAVQAFVGTPVTAGTLVA